MGEMSEWKK